MSEQDPSADASPNGWACFPTTLTMGESEGRGRRHSVRETHRPAVVVTFDGEPTDILVLRRSASEADAQQALADVEAAIAAADSDGLVSLNPSVPLLHMRPDDNGVLSVVDDR